MYRTDQFDSLLAQATKGLMAPFTEAEWLAYERKSPRGGNGWKADLPDNPQPGPYQPSGHARFDALIEKVPNLTFAYGANGPRTNVESKTTVLAALDRAKQRSKAWMDLPASAVSISLPNIADFDNSGEYVQSLAHELTHWAENHEPETVLHSAIYQMQANHKAGVGGLTETQAAKMGATTSVHPEELGMEEVVADPTYVIAELTAEMGAMLLLAATGEEPYVEDRVHYMQGYMGAVPPMFKSTVIDIAAQRAKQAVTDLLHQAT